ncbi:hypothetical protein MKW92_052658, partial [Papaver armeniacum]
YTVDIEVPQRYFPSIVFEAVAGTEVGVRFIPMGVRVTIQSIMLHQRGIISKIVRKEKGGYEISIADTSYGHQVVDIIPPGPELLVSEGESIKLDQPLTSNPNVGGFGQGVQIYVLINANFRYKRFTHSRCVCTGLEACVSIILLLKLTKGEIVIAFLGRTHKCCYINPIVKFS